MAAISKRKGARGVTFNVKIRKKGYPLVSRSFKDGTEAKERAAAKELAMTRGEAPRDRTAHEMTVGQAIERYSKVIMPHHRGKRSESYRAMALLQSRLADVKFAELNLVVARWPVENGHGRFSSPGTHDPPRSDSGRAFGLGRAACRRPDEVRTKAEGQQAARTSHHPGRRGTTLRGMQHGSEQASTTRYRVGDSVLYEARRTVLDDMAERKL
nr:hypothetical protein [Burkholderia sp. AU30198]